jgi:hypothetical protein
MRQTKSISITVRIVALMTNDNMPIMSTTPFSRIQKFVAKSAKQYSLFPAGILSRETTLQQGWFFHLEVKMKNAFYDQNKGRVQAMRRAQEISVQMSASLTDDEKIQLTELYPVWETGNGGQFKVGAIVQYELNTWGEPQLWECIQAHSLQDDWAPDVATSLWKKIGFANGYEVWSQPYGAHDAYAVGDRVMYNGAVWESKIDGNVYAPGIVAGQWTEV